MSSTRDFETVAAHQDLPLEFHRRSVMLADVERRNVCLVSGLIGGRQQDEVICPALLRRNLVVPRGDEPIVISAGA